MSTELKGSKLVSGSHKELEALMPHIYNAESALMCHGHMGIGKTEFFAQFAKKKAEELKLRYSEDINDINKPDVFMFISFIAHQMDMAEVKGLMYPNKERTKTIVLPLGNLPSNGQGIILFDEINLAPPAIQNNLYQLVQRAQLGFYKVPDGYRCYCAGNTIEDGANIYDMPMPLNNRLVHFDFKVPSVDAWIEDYAIPNGIDHRIIAYLSWQRGHIFQYNPDSDEDVKAFATPRSWKYVSDLIKPVTDEDTVRSLTGLAIGESMGTEFTAFLALSTNFKIPKIFKERTLEIPTRVDLLYSLSTALVSYWKEGIEGKKEEVKDDRTAALFTIALLFKKEHAAMMLSQCKSIDPTVFKRLKRVDSKLYTEFVNALSKVLL